MSSSFPYFTIAKDLGVSYAEVLAIVDFIEKYGCYDPMFGREVYCHVENAVLMEYGRRKIVHDSSLD
jgi:hypothetical protein